MIFYSKLIFVASIIGIFTFITARHTELDIIPAIVAILGVFVGVALGMNHIKNK
ncbi:MAG: hypothetical protein LBT10_06320 [Methanobrevibacter sp.]|jgi:hypothetical protein|nr:hypothetical protein [Methanobrevibacter sp.]